jgi:hypothetical protein
MEVLYMHRFQALLVLSLAPVLAVVAPSPLASASTDVTAPLVAVVGLLAWACTGWLLLVVAVTVGGRLPGTVGQHAHRLSLHVAPASVRSLVRVALGAGVAAAVLSGPSLAYADATPPPAVSSSYEWPGVSTEATPSPLPSSLPVSLDWPGTTTAPSPAAGPTASPTAALGPNAPIAATVTNLPAQGPRHATPRPPSSGAGGGVVVQVGDSLWTVAARQLGPSASNAQIAEAWPRWWSANRVLVGDDPGLIHPGNRLTPPTP